MKRTSDFVPTEEMKRRFLQAYAESRRLDVEYEALLADDSRTAPKQQSVAKRGLISRLMSWCSNG